MPVRRRRRGDPDRAAGLRRRGLARVRRGRRRRARPTATAPPGRTTRPAGVRCNPAKLLLDPYARAIDRRGPVRARRCSATTSPTPTGPARSTRPATSPAAWSSTRPSTGPTAARPRHRYADTVIYEVHVKGFTTAHPDVPARAPRHLRRARPRGGDRPPGRPRRDRRRAAPGAPAACPRRSSSSAGLTNYWGYNTIGFFAPHAGYSAAVRAGRPGRPGGRVPGDGRRAARAPAWRSCSTSCSTTPPRATTTGPTLCHRGLDNPAYYRLDPADPRRYVDTTGCGNSLNAADPVCLQLIMDSLRYWLTEMRVDGFRFDLAPTLAREDGGFDRLSAFFDLVAQDPVVSPGQADRRALGRRPGRQLRHRPLPAAVERVERPLPRHHARLLAPPGRARRRVRDPLQRLVGPLRRLAPATHRLGQPDHRARRLHAAPTWSPTTASTTRPTARTTGTAPTTTARGTAASKGPTDDPEVLALRARQSRALLTTLLLSFGVPMLLGGDELGRTQRGNNNAYCQDNPTTWFDWSSVDEDLLAFTRRLIALRRAHPVFRRRRFLSASTRRSCAGSPRPARP